VTILEQLTCLSILFFMLAPNMLLLTSIFVRELVASKDLKILFVPSADQIADVLTKPLASRRFHHLSYKLNVRSLPLNLREDINAQHTPRSIQTNKSSSEWVKEKPN
jgi:hypothetical protein